jgi:hypothetical protein
MKIPPVATYLFHAHCEKGMTELIVALGNFAKSPKKTSSFNHAAYSYKLPCQRLNRSLLFSSVSFTTEQTID